KVPDGDGTLLDHALILYGSPLGNPNVHNHKRVPLFLAGHAGGAIKGRLHVGAPVVPPLAKLYLTLLHKRVLRHMPRSGDSNREIEVYRRNNPMLRKGTIVGFCVGLAAILYLTSFLVADAVDTRVADAAQKGDKDTVRSLIKQAVDVNAAQGDGMTALHWAALNGDMEMAQLLVYAGANVKATTRLGGYTPLYMAAKGGHAPVINVLLRAGADPKSTAVAGLAPLMMAASSGNAAAVELLIKQGADVNAKETENG